MRQFWTGCILLSTALSSSAVTLGRQSGFAVIGRPLDVRVQLLLAPGEDLASQCVRAEVFYGDSQVSGNAVRSSLVLGTAEPAVRIQAQLPVNEPIVTLQVMAGCQSPFSRRFVLLADLSGQSADTTVSPAPAVSTLTSASVPAPSSPTSATSLPASSSAGSAGANKARVPKPHASKPASSVVRRAPAAAAAPALKLDPVDIDLNLDRELVLRISRELSSEPAATEEARNQARQLWRAINASPDEVLRDAQKLAALEGEAAQLREARAQSQAREADLSSALASARDARYRNGLVYTLGGALLIALMGLAWLWKRRGRAPTADSASVWWAPGAADEAVTAQASRQDPSDMVPLGMDSSVDLPIDLMSDSSHGADLAPTPATTPTPAAARPVTVAPMPAAERREFAPSVMGGSRSVATEELFDVQQQADFFISLGDDEQAIRVLRNHLTESQEPSPLAYLDLFQIYHRLNRREDYEQLREEFNSVFNAGAPPFEHYADQGRGLENYETAFRRIEALWPEPRVLDLIERSIFRDGLERESEVFDLGAYRELLLLHAVAKDIIQKMPAKVHSPGDVTYQATTMEPLKAFANSDGASPTMPMGVAFTPSASPNLGLDINLDDVFGDGDFDAFLPDPQPAEQTPALVSREGAASVAENLIDFEIFDFDQSSEAPPIDGKAPPVR